MFWSTPRDFPVLHLTYEGSVMVVSLIEKVKDESLYDVQE